MMTELIKNPNEPTRTRVLRFNLFTLVELFKGRPVQAVVNVLPADAQILSIGHDWEGRLTAIIASKAFEEVPNGGRLPEHPDVQFEDVARRLDSTMERV